MKYINDFKKWYNDHKDTLSLELMAAIVAFYNWLEPIVKDCKAQLSVEYGTGKHTCGAYTVTVSEIAPSITVKGTKELAAEGITPASNPELFKEKHGSVRVSVK